MSFPFLPVCVFPLRACLLIAGLKRKCYRLFHKSKLVAANLTDWAFALRRTACPARLPSELRGGGRLWVAGSGPLRGTSLLQARVAACPCDVCSGTGFFSSKEAPSAWLPTSFYCYQPGSSAFPDQWILIRGQTRNPGKAFLVCCGEGASLFLTWGEGRGVSRGLAGGVA